ncbi:DUF6090 family protein [Seonamhaeicola sp. MEBiC1930]|uniref:DUF6090 family protein n=1 Tax=Seonamhaeicola sp. MEBiC01930 TaxID=2976768 RepID=UPI0032520EFE
MIKFFRNIRKKLLNEGNTSKYLKYAFGEIILVVIGILIALQINNWNENRKQTAEEIRLLENLKVSLLRDTGQLSRFIVLQRRIPKSANLILEYLEKDLPYQDSLKTHFGNTTNLFIWNHDKSGYETIQSKGMHVITNEYLRRKISSYYAIVEESHSKYMDMYQDFLLTSINEILKTRFDQIWEGNAMEFYKNFSYESPISKMTPLDFESLKSDQEYLFFLKTISNFYDWIIEGQYFMQSDAIEELIPKIDEEIERLKNN